MSSRKKAKKELKSEVEEKDKDISKFFRGIFERNIDRTPTSGSQLVALSGFPVAPLRDPNFVPVESHGKKKSIFAQQFEHSDLSLFGLKRLTDERNKTFERSGHSQDDKEMELLGQEWTKKEDQVTKSLDTEELGTASELSRPMDWSSAASASEMKEIDEENRKRLAGMTEEEILSKQHEILSSSDPLMSIMAAYLKNRKQRNDEACSNSKEPFESSNVVSTANIKPDIGLSDMPVKPKSEWIHMDTVEYEKIAWMKDLPLPSADNEKTGHPARFDFDGRLVDQEADVPVHLGLHHHGEEPERAGYTLQELFQLSRSTNVQQRALALTTIGHVIVNARKGSFADCLSSAVIPSLVDGGLVFLLRWALDENSQLSIAASIGALHALLVCEEDELASDEVLCWHDGCTVPSFLVSFGQTKDDDEDEKQETDAEVVKKDIVKGLLRMHLPERLRYLLEVCRPAASVVIEIMEILTRLARHSMEAAYQVFKCPRLIDTVVKEFLPVTWTTRSAPEDPLPSAYGYPLPLAIKMIRVLCSAGRHIAAVLLSKYNILRYVVEEPSEMDLPADVAYNVVLESWRLWLVLLQYGLALNLYCDFFHIVMERLRKIVVLQEPLDKSVSSFGCTILGVVEATIHCAAEVKRHSEITKRETSQLMKSEYESHSVSAIPAFNWSPVIGLFPLFSELCFKNLRHFTNFYFEKPYNLGFTATSVNILASYYDRITDQPQYSPVQTEKEVVSICSDYLVPCLTSRAFTLSLKYVRDYSVYNSEDVSVTEESSDSLKTLGALIGAKGSLCPVLQPQSTVAFSVSILRLLIAFGKLCHGIIETTFPLVLNHEETLQYIRRICRTNMHSMATNYFSRFENEFHYCLIQMAKMMNFKDSGNCTVTDMTMYHFLALNLVTRLHVGDEHLCHGLLSTVLFNVEFLCDLSISEDVGSDHLEDRLRLNIQEPLTSATQQKISLSKSNRLQDMLQHLASMRSTYLTSASVSPSQLVHSRNHWLHGCLDRDSLISGSVGQLLVPVDWVFLPLLQVHSRSHDPAVSHEERLQPGLVTKVKDSLRTMYLLEAARPNVLDGVSATLKLSRLMCTFLAGSDLFLDPTIHGYLAELLKLYCLPKHLNRMDFTKPIPGIASFHDLYLQLVAQYESVSYGDSLFGCYLLLPLQQQHSVSLRALLWDENVTALRSIFIPVKELLIPVERFLQPEESDLRLLRLYFQALFSRTILPNRCPVPYLIAVHHVNRFFYTVEKEHRRLRHDMIRELLKSNNEELRHHLLYYKNMNIECNNAMELYAELPLVRQTTIDAVQGSSCS